MENSAPPTPNCCERASAPIETRYGVVMEIPRKRKVSSAELPENACTLEEEDVIGPMPAKPSEAAVKKRKGISYGRKFE